MKRLLIPITLLSLSLLAVPSFAQTAKKKKVVKKPPTVGTLGTSQMKGANGLFGTTYTLANSGGYTYNITMTSAEYTVNRHNITPDSRLIPAVGEKILLLKFKAQNPIAHDMYFGHSFLSFSTVAADNKTRDHNDYLRLVSAKDIIGESLKPGQKFPEEIVAACIVPAVGPVPKLIVNMGRKGTTEEVTRFFLGTAPNIVKPLPVGDGDPKDSTGATALTEVPAKVGTSYVAGHYDIRVDSIAYAPGPFGELKAEDGKQFLVVTVNLTNKIWGKNYFKDALAASLATSDDEKTETYTILKGKRDEPWEGRQIEADESVTLRLVFTIPKDTTGKTLKLAEVLDNTDRRSRAFIFDLTGVK